MLHAVVSCGQFILEQQGWNGLILFPLKRAKRKIDGNPAGGGGRGREPHPVGRGPARCLLSLMPASFLAP